MRTVYLQNRLRLSIQCSIIVFEQVMELESITVGVVTDGSSISPTCAGYMKTWKPPYPGSCPRIGLYPQIFAILANYAQYVLLFHSTCKIMLSQYKLHGNAVAQS